jgi:hypothetical protein
VQASPGSASSKVVLFVNSNPGELQSAPLNPEAPAQGTSDCPYRWFNGAYRNEMWAECHIERRCRQKWKLSLRHEFAITLKWWPPSFSIPARKTGSRQTLRRIQNLTVVCVLAGCRSCQAHLHRPGLLELETLLGLREEYRPQQRGQAGCNQP